jgi:hypothetical protein
MPETRLQAALERKDKALRAVEEWWLREGMQHFTGAPYAIFAAREALNCEAGSWQPPQAAIIRGAVWEVLTAWRPEMSAEVKYTLGCKIAERAARKLDTAAPHPAMPSTGTPESTHLGRSNG